MSETKLRVIEGGVKQGGGSAALYYLPHQALMARAWRLPFSAGAKELLGCLLEGCGRRGKGEGCKPEEALTVRREKQLAEDTRGSRRSVQRSKAELAPVLRIVIIREGQLLPRFDVDPVEGEPFMMGPRATVTACAYYVNVDEIARMLRLTRLVAMKPKAAPAPGSPPAAVASRRLVEELTALWMDRVGKKHEPMAATIAAVATAIAAVLEKFGGTEQDVRDVIDGRADKSLGGDSFAYCEARGVWDDCLFINRSGGLSGVFEKMRSHVHKARLTQRDQRARHAAEIAADRATQEQAVPMPEDVRRKLLGRL